MTELPRKNLKRDSDHQKLKVKMKPRKNRLKKL